MLKLVEWSMARTLIVLPLNVRAQQVPHAAEPNPVTAGAPPMKGKLGNEPKVVNPKFSRPFGPLEQETVLRDPAALSNVWSKDTVLACARARPAAASIEKTIENFIVII